MLAHLSIYCSSLSVVCRVVLSVVVTFSCVVPEVCKGMMLALWLFSRKAVLSFGNEELS